MRKSLIGFVGLCLATGLLANDAMAQRRGGGRGRVGGGMGAGAVRRPPGFSGNPGTRFTPPGKVSGSGPKFTPPGKAGDSKPKFMSQGQQPPWSRGAAQGKRANAPDRINRLREVRDGTPSTIGQNALGWIDSANRPFTAGWYADHPKAWQVTHPHADAVAVATVAGLTRWLTIPYAYSSAIGGASTTTELYTSVEEPVADDVATPADAGEAADPTEWMQIGVFALKPAGQPEATRVVQLALNHDGTIRGSHYDVISEDVQEIHGSVNKTNLRAAWTVGRQGSVAFAAPLEELTKPQGNVTAHFPGGKTGSWQTIQVTE